jgi:hypothetical protein
MLDTLIAFTQLGSHSSWRQSPRRPGWRISDLHLAVNWQWITPSHATLTAELSDGNVGTSPHSGLELAVLPSLPVLVDHGFPIGAHFGQPFHGQELDHILQ